MKIGYICVKNLITSGGVEKYTWEMSKCLAARGHKIYIFTTDKVLIEQIDGIEIISVPSFGGRFLEKITGSAFATFKALRRGLDIYHFQAFGAGMFAFVPRLFGKTTISQGHGIEWKRSKWGVVGKSILRITEFMSVKFANHVMAVSHTQAKDISQRYHREVEVVSGGVVPPQKVDANEIKTKFELQGNDYFLFVARLVPEKGVHYLIDAYKKLANPGKKVVIVGEAEIGSEYHKRINSLAQGNSNIIFTGFQTGRTLQELFSNAYAYILPSELEGLSISLLEAMSYGLCCIVSDIPENLEAIAQSKYGISFTNKDANDLARKLEYVQEMSDEVVLTGESAKEYVIKNFNWDRLSSKLNDYYLEVKRS